MDLEVVGGTLRFSLSQTSYLWKVTMFVTLNKFGFSPPSYSTHVSSQSYQRSSGFDASWNSKIIFQKENDCKLNWQRPYIKIIIIIIINVYIYIYTHTHIPTAWIQYEFNSTRPPLVWKHKIKTLIHNL